jgi:UDP-GlcNAc:undecaprenyl-phosphate GlcNAc-1-phosphate transferase
MLLLALLSAVSCGLCLLLTPLVRGLAHRFGFLDLPDARKTHGRPIPRVGGVAIALSYAATFGLLAPLIHPHLALAWKLLPAAGIVFFTGLLDDLRGLKPWQKLLGQTLAAGIAWWGGVRVAEIAGLHLGSPVGMVVSVVWLVGCANAFNLIDGMDGLASGVGLFATLTTLVAALLNRDFPLALATAPLAGCLLGFLRFNFNPASIFLGDCGSLLIGFLLGCYGVIWTQKSATALAVTAPLMALAIPLADTALAIVRRFLRHQPIFSPDRDHIHHQLLNRGLTPRRVALVLYTVCGMAATLSLLLSVAHEHFAGAVLVTFCAAAWIGVQHLGYAEFDAAGRTLTSGVLRRMVNTQICMRAFEDVLARAETPEECWQALCSASKDFGFNRVRLRVADGEYEARFGDAPPESCWTLRIPINGSEHVELTREFHSLVQPILTTRFVDLVHTRLQARLRDVERQPGAAYTEV